MRILCRSLPSQWLGVDARRPCLVAAAWCYLVPSTLSYWLRHHSRVMQTYLWCAVVIMYGTLVGALYIERYSLWRIGKD